MWDSVGFHSVHLSVTFASSEHPELLSIFNMLFSGEWWRKWWHVQTMNRLFTNSVWKNVHIFIYIPGTSNNQFLYKDLESSNWTTIYKFIVWGSTPTKLIKWYLPGTLKPTQFWMDEPWWFPASFLFHQEVVRISVSCHPSNLKIPWPPKMTATISDPWPVIWRAPIFFFGFKSFVAGIVLFVVSGPTCIIWTDT